MKTTVKVVVMMTIIAVIIGITNISNAFSFNASLASNEKLVTGQEVKVTLSLSNINMNEGIRSIKVGKITLGEEFEAISSTSFSSSTFSPTYSNGGLILMSGTPVTNAGVAVTLTLKVKPGITTKSSTIKFENIVASSGSNTGDISVGTKTITIKANETTESTNKNETGATNTLTNTNTNNTSNTKTETKNSVANVTNTTTKKATNSNTLPKKLPKAGNTEGFIMISLILVVAVVGIVSFIKYKK